MSERIANTLGVGATASQLEVVRSVDQLRSAVARWPGALVIGGASNVVLPERVATPVIVMGLQGIAVESRGSILEVTAAAGVGWHALVRYCLAQGWFGLENLALIPGSVGAAPLQNIGAYGVELADRMVRLRALRVADGKMCIFDRQDCGFSYRDSYFKSGAPGEFVVVDVTIALATTPELVLGYPDVAAELQRMGRPQPGPVDVAEAVVRVRRRKLPDPRGIGNVGSFFKNPIVPLATWRRLRAADAALVGHPSDGAMKLSAAQLIDLAGGKRLRVGDAAVWPRQPLVLVNRGAATGSDFLSLAGEIRAAVQARFDVLLEIEPRVCVDY